MKKNNKSSKILKMYVGSGTHCAQITTEGCVARRWGLSAAIILARVKSRNINAMVISSAPQRCVLLVLHTVERVVTTRATATARAAAVPLARFLHAVARAGRGDAYIGARADRGYAPTVNIIMILLRLVFTAYAIYR